MLWCECAGVPWHCTPSSAGKGSPREERIAKAVFGGGKARPSSAVQREHLGEKSGWEFKWVFVHFLKCSQRGKTTHDLLHWWLSDPKLQGQHNPALGWESRDCLQVNKWLGMLPEVGAGPTILGRNSPSGLTIPAEKCKTISQLKLWIFSPGEVLQLPEGGRDWHSLTTAGYPSFLPRAVWNNKGICTFVLINCGWIWPLNVEKVRKTSKDYSLVVKTNDLSLKACICWVCCFLVLIQKKCNSVLM